MEIVGGLEHWGLVGGGVPLWLLQVQLEVGRWGCQQLPHPLPRFPPVELGLQHWPEPQLVPKLQPEGLLQLGGFVCVF